MTTAGWAAVAIASGTGGSDEMGHLGGPGVGGWPDRHSAAPRHDVRDDGGTGVPWLALPFSRTGECEGPRTRAGVLEAAAGGGFTDCFLFSHGWNNDWDAAVGRYDAFVSGYAGLRKKYGLDLDRPFAPLLVGIFWPSTALVLPWERAPEIATRRFSLSPSETDELRALSELLGPRDGARLHELAELDRELRDDEAAELAHMLASLLAPDDEVGEARPPSAAELAAALADDASRGGYDESGRFGRIGDIDTGPDAALLGLGTLRKAVRLTTVRVMKDRAGTVGANGVGPFLSDLARAGGARSRAGGARIRIHLVGHSYGCKVLLSAATAAGTAVDSVLLLQPAVSRLCFARDAGKGKPGGYHHMLGRTHLPILTTYSKKDRALRRFFHLALRRDEDLGERKVAAGEPSPYAALGGYGPGGCDDVCAIVDMKQPNDWYRLDDDRIRVIGLRAHSTIDGHGDISKEATWWALHNLVAARSGRR